MVGNAATGEMLEAGVRFQLRIVAPALLAGPCVEREQDLVLRAEIERVADLDGSHLERGLRGIVRTLAVTGAEEPRDLQVPDVGRRDLLQRRIALAELTAAIGAPIFIR